MKAVSWSYSREISSSDPLFLYVTMQTEHELTKWQLRTGQTPTFSELAPQASQDIATLGSQTGQPSRYLAGQDTPPSVHLVEQTAEPVTQPRRCGDDPSAD
jgi:hypothetical protein